MFGYIRKLLLPKAADFLPIIPADDAEKAAAGHAVELAIETSQRTSDFIFEHVAITTRWIFASLVSVNGAGALAVASATALKTSARTSALEAFVFGVVFAVLTGYASALLTASLIGNVGKITGQLLLYRVHEVLTPEYQAASKRIAIRGVVNGLVIFAFGALSLAAFLVGAIRAGSGL
ncbi:MAG: hypothetical protein ACKO01_01525 [Erythrobacter sp.]